MTTAEEAALAAARGVFAPPADDVEAGETPSGDTGEVVAVATEETPSFEVDLPDDLLEFLSLDDESDLDVPADDEDDELDLDEVDPRLAKELRKAQKEAAFYKERVVKSSRSKWEAEAKQFFPLSEQILPQIEADSRRSFLRQAKAAHETVLPFVQAEVAKLNAEKAAAIEAAKEEALAEAKAAWGVPNAPGAPAVPADEGNERDRRIERGRQNRDLAATIKAMVFPGQEK